MSDIQQQIEGIVNGNKVVLFMKGTRMFPQCGFSARAVELFKQCGTSFKDVNVLADPAMREGIKLVIAAGIQQSSQGYQLVARLIDPARDGKEIDTFTALADSKAEVLGAVESGVDFEKRIAAIYQKCRTPQQIEFEFDQLQRELDEEIVAGQRDAREKLLDNFDQEVVEKVRIQSSGLLDRFNERLWQLTRHLLSAFAKFDEDIVH